MNGVWLRFPRDATRKRASGSDCEGDVDISYLQDVLITFSICESILRFPSSSRGEHIYFFLPTFVSFPVRRICLQKNVIVISECFHNSTVGKHMYFLSCIQPEYINLFETHNYLKRVRLKNTTDLDIAETEGEGEREKKRMFVGTVGNDYYLCS